MARAQANDVWADPGKVLWNYLAVVDASTDRSRVDIFRYKDERPAQLPELHTGKAWSHIFEPGLTGLLGDQWQLSNRSNSAPGTEGVSSVRRKQAHDGEDDDDDDDDDDGGDSGEEDDENESSDTKANVERYVQEITQFLSDSIPPDQVKRTPLFLHATGDIRSLKLSDKHHLLRSVCKSFKAHSELLISDCKKQIYDIDGQSEAILGWLSVNYENSHLLGSPEETQGLVVLGLSSFESATATNSEKKSKSYRVSIGLGNGSNQLFDTHAVAKDDLGYDEVRTFYMEQARKGGETAACLPEGAEVDGLRGTSDYPLCVDEIKALGLPEITLPNGVSHTYAAIDETRSLSGPFLDADANKIEQLCSMSWSDVQKIEKLDFETVEDLKWLCFGATFAERMLDQVRFSQDMDTPPSIVLNKGVDADEFTWTIGRALLYACGEQCTAKVPSGIQENVGATKWRFGADNGIKRPILDKSDWAGKFDKASHRMWGGIVFIVVLAALLYFLLGKRKFKNLWNEARRGNRYKGVNAEDFELDDLDDYDVE